MYVLTQMAGNHLNLYYVCNRSKPRTDLQQLGCEGDHHVEGSEGESPAVGTKPQIQHKTPRIPMPSLEWPTEKVVREDVSAKRWLELCRFLQLHAFLRTMIMAP